MIKTEGIRKSFGSLKVLNGIDLHIQPQEIVAIVGQSGAGKTTLLQIIGSLDRANEGEVWINNTPLSSLNETELSHFRNREIGFIFQFHQLLPEFSALENIMLPALIAERPFKEARTKALELLRHLDLTDRAEHKPAELSGGEKQRIAVARALINTPSVILADEPSGSLDSQNKQELHQLFFDLRRDYGHTFVIVTHDDQLATQSDRIIRMRDGIIID